jgi:uncharacterized protein YjiS (DUF1127 family)
MPPRASEHRLLLGTNMDQQDRDRDIRARRPRHRLRDLARRFGDVRRMRRSMAELRWLDDRSLEDIGLTQADRIAAR